MNGPDKLRRDPVLESLQLATRTPITRLASGAYLIEGKSFESMNDSVVGFVWKDNCPGLSFSEFQNEQIVFRINQFSPVSGDILYEYYTVGGRLHRGDDLPAKYIYTNASIHRGWYWNGVLHRETGPAEETFERITFSMKDDYSLLRAETYSGSFLHNGVAAMYPGPNIMVGEKVEFAYSGDGRPYQSELIPYCTANWLRVFWKIPAVQSHHLYPEQINLSMFSEFRLPTGRTIRTSSSYGGRWQKAGMIRNYPINGVMFPDSAILGDIGLWSAPFYPGPDIEVLMNSQWDDNA